MIKDAGLRLSICAVLLIAVVAGCGSSSSGGDQSAYQDRLCGALVSLQGNQDDILVLTKSQTATIEDARAAVRRMHDRTSSAVERMREAASAWAPGRDLATRLADAEAGLLPIIDTFDALVTSGDASLWPKVTHDYTTWYSQTSPVVTAAPAEFHRLGVDC